MANRNSSETLGSRAACAALAALVALAAFAGAAQAERRSPLATDAGAAPRHSPTPGLLRLAQATKAAAPAGEADAWAVSCSNRGTAKLTCEMTQSLVDQKSRRTILLISVKPVVGGGSTAMLFKVLHGAFLPAGLTISVDGKKPTTIQFQRSDTSGLYAALPLDSKRTDEMRRGKEIAIGLQLEQGKPVTLNARLKGFAGAMDKMKTIE